MSAVECSYAGEAFGFTVRTPCQVGKGGPTRQGLRVYNSCIAEELYLADLDRRVTDLELKVGILRGQELIDDLKRRVTLLEQRLSSGSSVHRTSAPAAKIAPPAHHQSVTVGRSRLARANEFYQKGCQEKTSASTGGEMFSRGPAHWNYAWLGKFDLCPF